jgi:hypothetical protein
MKQVLVALSYNPCSLEAEIRRIMVGGQPRERVCETPYLK